MRIDLYTKTILTLIALLLAVIVLRPIIQPTPALAQANMSVLQFSQSGGMFYFFDPRSGDVWEYNTLTSNGIKHFKLEKLGLPLGR
jgi:hypothetical protein